MDVKTGAKVCAVILAAVAGSAACSDLAYGGGPVSITLTADRTTAAVGQDVTFTYDVTGELLDGVTVEFGDGVADTMLTGGAQTARGRFIHAYGASGSFTALGVVYDNRLGRDSATVVVQVTGG